MSPTKFISLAMLVSLVVSSVARANAQDPAALERGSRVFKALNCAMCHPGGGNVLDPTKPLKGPSFAKKYPTDQSVAALIRNGSVNGGMPPFRRDQLPDNQLHDVIAYIRSLTPRANAPAAACPPAKPATQSSKSAPAGKSMPATRSAQPVKSTPATKPAAPAKSRKPVNK